MRFGCCLPFPGSDDDLARVALLADMGYQYIEPPVACLHVESAPEDYFAVRRAFRRAALKPEAFNCFIPGDLKVVGDQVDWQRVERFLSVAMTRLAVVGAQVVVFGSGAARSVPEGYPRDEALDQLRYFLNMAADYAGPVTIAVEPLSAEGSNILNTVVEAAALVHKVGRPQVRLLVDSFHMDAMGEPWSSISDAAQLLAHVHCCDREHRVPGTGGADLAGFFSALGRAGYAGRVSVKCPLSDFAADARLALAAMRDLAGVRS